MDMYLRLLFWLTAAHYLADFPLQGDFVAMNKGKYPYIMLAHCVIWTSVVAVVLSAFDVFAWWKILLLFGGHFLVDEWKCHLGKPGINKSLYIDQFIHFVQLAIVASF